MAEDHDSSYRLLFSNARMVADLLRGFVGGHLLKRMSLSSLEKRSEISIGDRLERREEDLVWRLRWDGGWAYVYILIEFQSGVDRHMALRMLTYLGLLYQDLLRQGEVPRSGLLPPVLPLVLSSGTPLGRSDGDKFESKISGLSVEGSDKAFLELTLVPFGPLVDKVPAMLEGEVDEPCELMSRSGDGFGSSEPRFHPTEECAESRWRALQAIDCHT